MKTYTAKSSAHRAAKAAGLSKEAYSVVEVDGKFGYVLTSQKDLNDSAPVIGDFHNCPNCKIHLSNGYQTHEGLLEDGCKGNKTHEYLCLSCDHEFGPELPVRAPAPTKVATGAKQVVSNVSVAAMPTKLVWEIAEQMFKLNPETRRKDVIAKCVDSGVAFNTARTQYQLWLTAHRASK